mmetsp:Transcript_11203/g.35559  ORF Transcript_11203/g.35559 Transcript_11203/m.35559 type:complete len:183 (+) Transcript_11203:3-551(+)
MVKEAFDERLRESRVDRDGRADYSTTAGEPEFNNLLTALQTQDANGLATAFSEFKNSIHPLADNLITIDDAVNFDRETFIDHNRFERMKQCIDRDFAVSDRELARFCDETMPKDFWQEEEHRDWLPQELLDQLDDEKRKRIRPRSRTPPTSLFGQCGTIFGCYGSRRVATPEPEGVTRSGDP